MPRTPRRRQDEQSAAIEGQDIGAASAAIPGSESPLVDQQPVFSNNAPDSSPDPKETAPQQASAPARSRRTRTPRAQAPAAPEQAQTQPIDSNAAAEPGAGDGNGTGNGDASPAPAPSSRSRSPRARSRSRLRSSQSEPKGMTDLDAAAEAAVPGASAGGDDLPAVADAALPLGTSPAAAPDNAASGAGQRRRPGGRRGAQASENSPAAASVSAGVTPAPATESETIEIATLIPGLDIDPQPLPGSQSTPDGQSGSGIGSGNGADGSQESEARSGASSRRSRRGGRRRRGAREQSGAVVAATDDAPAADEPAATGDDGVLDLSDAEAGSSTVAAVESRDSAAADDGGEARRARRPQRGGRRKGRAEGGDESAETPSGAAVAPLAEELPSLLPTLQARPVWTAPPLVPSLDAAALTPLALGIDAALNARARGFVINGEPVPANLFFVNSDAALLEGADGGGASLSPEVVASEIRRAAAAGIHLHTCVAYLPLLNAYGERSFAVVDAAVRAILDADPEAKLVLRVQCVPTNFWARTHEQEMAVYSDGSLGDVTIASSMFWADCVDALQALLARFADPATPGHGRVFALHLDKGEWFYEPGAGYDYSEANLKAFRDWLREKYQTVYALRAAWFDGKVTFETAAIPPAAAQSSDKRIEAATVLLNQKRDRRVVDYVTYASSVVGSVVCGLAAAVKAITGGKLLVFIPYGYLYEFAARNDSGHQALTQVLACDAIDVLTGPNSYLSRAPGGVGGFAAPVDSLPLHDKMWIVEDDTKTYLAAEDGTPDSYNPRIIGQQETVMVLRRNFYAALAHGCGLSWMDLWGQGWLDSDSLWDEISQMLAASEAVLQAGGDATAASAERAPEVAVLVDDASYAWVRDGAAGRQLQTGLILKARDLLQRSGASIGYYLQSDAGRLPESIKAVFFLNALSVSTAERQAIRERLQTAGKTLVWVYAPGLYDENGPAVSEPTEIVGMPLKAQPWNSQVGTLFTDERHPVTERLRGGKRMGTEEALNPSYIVIDPQATVLGVYAQSGEPSIAAKIVQPTEGGAWSTLFVGEPQFTGELVRGILRYAGVHLYDTQDDIVFVRENAGAGVGLLAVHAPYTGQRVIQLPRPAACYNATEKRLVAQHSTSARLFVRGRSTQVFFWGDLDAVARQAAMTVDDLIATQAAPQQRGGEGEDDAEGRVAAQPDESQTIGEATALEYPHDREYIVSSERMAATVEFTSVASSSVRSGALDTDSEIEPALEQVLRAVVEEVYSGAYTVGSQAVEAERDADDPGPAARLTPPAPDALRDARREASRITEALLADISGDLNAEGALEPADGETESGALEEADPSADADDAQRSSSSSSRRRRWRRKRQQTGESGEAAGAQPESGQSGPKFPIEQFIGDLLRRRKPSEPPQ